MRRLLDETELEAVRSARRRGRSWAEIATKLGVSRQAAWSGGATSTPSHLRRRRYRTSGRTSRPRPTPY
ncbi:hypothetical protein ACFQV8_03060 [Pseudonocardia benzenivorans]